MMTAFEEEKRPRYAESKRKGREEMRSPPPPFRCSMAQVHLILDKWIKDKVITLPFVSKEPSVEDRANPRYCRYHRYLRHPTKDCWTLQRLFDSKYKSGELIFEEENDDVNHRPFPDHGKGPAQVRVMTNQDDDFQMVEFLPRPERPSEETYDDTATLASNLVNNAKFRRFYDDMGFTPAARLAATKALIEVSVDFGSECFAVNSFTKSRAPMMCFSDKDLGSRVMHNQALYVAAIVDGIEVTRALVDGGAGVNVMPLATFRSLGISEDRLVPSIIKLTGIEEKPMPTLGYVVVNLVVGPLKMMGRFHITKPHAPFHIVLGRPWIHSHEAVPSTYHRCVKAWQGGREITIRASTAPYEAFAMRKTDSPSLDKATEKEECMIQAPRGIKLLENIRPENRYEDTSQDTSHKQPGMQRRDGGREGEMVRSSQHKGESSQCNKDRCKRLILPDGRIAYSVCLINYAEQVPEEGLGEEEDIHVWKEEPKPPNAVWVESRNCSQTYWIYLTPPSYSQEHIAIAPTGWGDEFNQEDRQTNDKATIQFGSLEPVGVQAATSKSMKALTPGDWVLEAKPSAMRDEPSSTSTLKRGEPFTIQGKYATLSYPSSG